MSSSSFYFNSKLPITVPQARRILGTNSIDMDDEDIENMVRRMMLATEVIISVIDGSKSNAKVETSDFLQDNG